MKVVAFNGSPHEKGNTYEALHTVTTELEAAGIETEIITVGNKVIRGCMACNGCARNRDERCVMHDDPVNEWIQKIKEADGILLGSPTHFSAIGGTMKSFLDRAFYVASSNNGLFRHKVGASIVADRRAGGIPVFDQLNNFLTYSEMIIPTSNYWNVAYGTKAGEVTLDGEGMQIMQVLGQNMAWLLKVLAAGKPFVEEKGPAKKVFTNFIR